MFTTEFTTKRVVFQCVRAMRKRSLLQQNLQQRLQQNLNACERKRKKKEKELFPTPLIRKRNK